MEEESSSSAAQEKYANENTKIYKRHNFNNTNVERSFSVQDICKELNNSQNFCSSNLKNIAKTKNVKSRSFCLKKYFSSKSNLFNGEKVKCSSNKNEVDLKMEQVQKHSIIFNVEEKSQCKQVSL